MKSKNATLAQELKNRLREYSRNSRPLPGVQTTSCLEAFVEQVVASTRRIAFAKHLCAADVSPRRASPAGDIFDPLKAAIFHKRQGNVEEAFWLVFLFVYFGKPLRSGWRTIREVYGSLGGTLWSWDRISRAPDSFRGWLSSSVDRIFCRFGNHRKYETLRTDSQRGAANVFESYVKWIAPPRTHEMLVKEATESAGGDPKNAFHYLYNEMNSVLSFGRTAKFDYLTMVGKLGLGDIEPGFPYLDGSTGPLRGAQLLFGGSISAQYKISQLDEWVADLGRFLPLGNYAMQVMEDSLCNWQKQPERFIPFRG